MVRNQKFRLTLDRPISLQKNYCM